MVFFVGAGNNYTSNTIHGLISGKKYRITLEDVNWNVSDTSQPTLAKFDITIDGIRKVYVPITGTPNKSYELDYEGSGTIQIGGRADFGVKVRYHIENISVEDNVLTVIDDKIQTTKPKRLVKNLLELGNVSISTSGWNYSNSTTRVRVIKGKTLHLVPGDIIGLTDYSNARFFIGWRLSDDTYKSGNSWKTADYTITEEGEYCVLLSNIQETTTTVESLGSLLFIKTYYEQGYAVSNEFSNKDNVLLSGSAINSAISTLSAYTSYVFGVTSGNKPIINYDTTAQTVTIAKDTILCAKGINGNNSYYVVANEAVISLENTTSSAVCIFLNKTDGTIVARNYSATYNDDFLFIAGIRKKVSSNIPSIVTLFPWSIDGIPYNYVPRVNKQLRCKTNVKMMAHRGFHYCDIPENSLDAYRIAGYMGYDYVETDFCATSDGVLVLSHDSTINRTMKNADYTDIEEAVYINDKTFSELRANYVLASANTNMRKPIPSLEEFFITCKESGVFPIAEIKSAGITNEKLQEAFNLGKEILGEGNFGFNSFSYSFLDYVRSLSEKTPLLYIGTSTLNTTNSITGESRETPSTIWYPEKVNLTDSIVKEYKRKGLKVATYLVTTSDFDQYMKIGVDILATDNASPNLGDLNGTVYEMKNFNITGVRDGNIIKLNQSQRAYIDYTFKSRICLYFFSINGKGSYHIGTNNLTVDINNTITTRNIFQGVMYDYSGATNRFSILASADGVELDAIELKIVEIDCL